MKKWYVRINTTVSHDLKYNNHDYNRPLIETFGGPTSDSWVTVLAPTADAAEQNTIDGINICCEPLWAPKVRAKKGILVIYALDKPCRVRSEL